MKIFTLTRVMRVSRTEMGAIDVAADTFGIGVT